jgi:MFS superfamily sulfate permease-like transporter
MTCLLSVLVLGSIPGVIIAFLLSTIDMMRRAANPHTSVLTELPDGSGFQAAQQLHNTMTAPGLIVYRFSAPLFFGNANIFGEQVEMLVEKSPSPVEWFVLDAESITDIDTTGVQALEQAIEHLTKSNITFAVARAHVPIRQLLHHYELIEQIG